MLIMALESAIQESSVAIWQNGIVLASSRQDITRTQAEMLVLMAKATLDQAHLSFSDVDLFAVTVGPGSFTGVRVGLATARGFGLATMRPVAGVTTMEAVAWAVNIQQSYHEHCKSHYVLVALTTHYKVFHVQPFSLTATLPVPLCPVQTLLPAAIADFLTSLPKDIIVVSNNIDLLVAYLPENIRIINGIQPQAWAAAAVAAARETKSRLAPEPLYSRIPVPAFSLPQMQCTYD